MKLRPSGAQDTMESVLLSSTRSYVFVKKGGGWFELASAAADAPLDRELDPLSVIYCAALALDGRWQCKRTVQQTVVQ